MRPGQRAFTSFTANRLTSKPANNCAQPDARTSSKKSITNRARPIGKRTSNHAEVIIVGGGLAGLSAAVYLGRAKRDVLLIDSGRSMARWEPDVQNYLGFPDSIAGDDLLARGHKQARIYRVRHRRDKITSASVVRGGGFRLRGAKAVYRCQRLLLATEIGRVHV